ncbi:hypothetical protein SK128_019057, partial [Halocaridina rubra]
MSTPKKCFYAHEKIRKFIFSFFDAFHLKHEVKKLSLGASVSSLLSLVSGVE